ncbi:5,6-dimethylbenzimidazole synthase [Knoellia subterranea]|uniref:Nicotinate-nucleotide--dimethylbenzimidazole phosphoribosyltransferase n=1 Tax=Knoellia subterranea KCTC 19937 TaxID=1385521 RepID=A0A0A0JI60_9MICO|nr:5,6-dimethylbenzimidazole synthase [Knoellia subterranea]KGN36813.1 phosphoribosyltransferase [Knoellia subterranea KCTC 19937]
MEERSAGMWPRPTPLVGDTTSARERADDPSGWAFGDDVIEALDAVIAGRRDIRRFRPDPVPSDLLTEVLTAGHRAPSVGHSQPWRFIVVRDPSVRDRAAHLADRARLDQAALLTNDRAARMLDLKLEGLREAPVGVVVVCDRRTPAAGVLGRATFPDADLWSCATAIENMWLAARARGLGMGWVTLFDPDELSSLLGLPEDVVPMGWMCLGWPDERPPTPGLERAAWSKRLPLEDVVMEDRWFENVDAWAPTAPVSHLGAAHVGDGTHAGHVAQALPAESLVAATDTADGLLSPAESLGVLDRVVSRVEALGRGVMPLTGTLVLVGAAHPVAALGVSAFEERVTRDVLEAAVAGSAMGAVAARSAGLGLVVIDAGVPGEKPVGGALPARPLDLRGDLSTTDALTRADVDRLLATGRRLGEGAARTGLVALGEVGIGNTTVAAALACAVTGLSPLDAVGVGAGADSDIVERKRTVVEQALARIGPRATAWRADPADLLAAVGGAEIALLTGVVLGAASGGAPVVLDGLAGSLPGVLAVSIEPSVQSHLIAGQRSRERAHAEVLRLLGLEPLLSLRLRAGEGVGAALAASLVLQGLKIRRGVARTQ